MAPKGWRTEKVYRPRADVQLFVDVLEREMPEDEDWFIGGSWRRGAPQIGDLDVLIIREPYPTLDGFAFPKSFHQQRGAARIGNGDLYARRYPQREGDSNTATTPGMESIHIDFWVCTPEQRGAFGMFITGPKDLNIVQRRNAKEKGFTLSQYGLYENGKQIDNGTEQDIYRLLGEDWVPPEERQRFATGTVDETEIRTRMYTARSDSDPSKNYLVTYIGRGWPGDSGQWSCECLAFEYSKKYPKDCKHIGRVQQAISRGALKP